MLPTGAGVVVAAAGFLGVDVAAADMALAMLLLRLLMVINFQKVCS